MRAIHSLGDDDPIINDPYGLDLVGKEERVAIRNWLSAINSNAISQAGRSHGQDNDELASLLRAHPGYGNVIIRTRYSEDRLELSLRFGATNYVIVGAGLDTFCFRQPDLDETLRIYEIGHPATQEMKRGRLKSAGLLPPSNVVYLPADLEQESVTELLESSDFDRGMPGFFACLGLSPYLTRQANIDIVRSIAESSEAEVQLVLNYVTGLSASQRSSDPESAEPIITRFEREDVQAILERCGFEVVEDLGPAELVDHYCADRRDRLRPANSFRIVHARRPKIQTEQGGTGQRRRSTILKGVASANLGDEKRRSVARSMNTRFRPIYICGSMRSGTTILQKLICLSSGVNAFAPAARYLTEQVRIYAQFAGVDSLYVVDYLGDAEAFRAFTNDLVDRVLTQAWSIAGKPSALVLKSPELSYLVPSTLEILGTTARFIFSVREPKDTITSMLYVGERQRAEGVTTMLSQTGRNIEALCNVYNSAYVPILQSLSNTDSPLRERVQFVRYEDLVTRPEQTQERICAFCEIEPTAIPVEGGWPASESIAGLAEHRKWRTYMTDLSSQAISDASIGRHKSLLTAEECDRIDDRCRAVREFFGYR